MLVSSVSLSQEKIDYADEVALKETAARRRHVSRSEVFGWGLTVLKYFRHDWATPLQHVKLIAEQLRRGQLTRDEAAAEILRTVDELEKARTEAMVLKAPAT